MTDPLVESQAYISGSSETAWERRNRTRKPVLEALKAAGVCSKLEELAEILGTTFTIMREVSSGRQHSLPRDALVKLKALCDPRRLDWTVFFEPEDYPDLIQPTQLGVVRIEGVFNLGALDQVHSSPFLTVWQSPVVSGLIVRFAGMAENEVCVIRHPFLFMSREVRVMSLTAELRIFGTSDAVTLIVRQEGRPQAGGVAIRVDSSWKFFGG